MRELRTAVIVANEASMLRASMRGPIILVEGDTDTLLYRKFILPSPYVRVTHCDGKPILMEAMTLIRARGVRGVLGICDADFDRVAGRRVSSDVVFADLHDAEMMIVHSRSFRHVCEELYGSSLSDRTFQSVRDSLLEIAAHIGSIRLWNEESAARLKFGAVNPGQALGEATKFHWDQYLAELLEASPNSLATLAQVRSAMESRRKDIHDGELACGHDFSALLDADAAHKNERDPYGAEVVEKMLRLSFDASCFGETGLVAELVKWEARHDVDVLVDEALPMSSPRNKAS